MDALADTLQQVERLLGDAATGVFDGAGLRAADDPELLGLLAQVAAVSRLVDAVLVGVVAEVGERADAAPHAERITTVHGCRSVRELVQRVTRQSSRTVGEVLRGARAVARPVAVTTGELLPAAYPAMRDALASGAVGVDGLVAVVAALDGAGCAAQARRAADEELGAAARGAGCDGAPAPGADELRVQAQVWAMFLDQDGAEPRETRALRKRGLTLGVCRDGLVPIRGQLLPEVAGQLETLFHSILNPKTGGPAAPAGPHFTVVDAAVDDREVPFQDQADPRTRVQRQHDAFATVLSVAARSAEVPTIGGAAPTLVVSVIEGDLRSGTGHAHLDGCDEPVSLTVARHVACTGTIQRVTSDQTGRIRAIHTIDRVFGPHQRKAITLRDGGCIIPGCHVPAAWCEIHHVHEHAHGGPTHTDNGVLLCWHHHRTLDTSGWTIRMRNGIPEVRGPSWWDTAGRWRPTTTSPTRLRQHHTTRTATSGGP
ncbi:HNH endonuclease signature motif containing protein [Microbacterium sp. SSM24]|uniref:HNH endonuclease signature motif containing protein n=1 Tax=Microbacterium sp. SSM24 TaxID=2991714 RepID=UPI00222778C5|nr:HNH endonuclease signature motif containing protein [Microbacterium sp. SSM24]MCW3494175.1 HNH endonuclease [Microbacterium sp. SSM24]